MKTLALMLFTAAAAVASPPSAHLGLQFWSLRAQFKDDVPRTLQLARDFGFTLVETAGTYGLDPAVFRAEIERHGMRAVSAHFGYLALDRDLSGTIAQAQALGVRYVVVPYIPHGDRPLDAAQARAAAAKLNVWGAALRANGLKLAYHTHGYEFSPGPDGETPFDVLARSTRPDLLSLEMDVFWVAHAGADPVQLLNRYPGRWKMLHLKDLRAGARTDETGAAPATDILAVGQGVIPWPRVFRAARAAGVEYYFIEDESVDPVRSIPASLRYLAPFHL